MLLSARLLTFLIFLGIVLIVQSYLGNLRSARNLASSPTTLQDEHWLIVSLLSPIPVHSCK